ncbi:hypothetical protein [Paeniglutamicibacter kerguelensis]|uniref:Uncharacterized protein n=1 Tax=Paeniglutamicibacter kerguelensis TaxID=254788 RepID=A0ABS4XBJ3_9MICC|nr:hypothetical protein [Paeniglutamicibacter kerguelensis]MBP2385835.1 hypothetical protein [Paeniglutamicibacter kerguelensis]
MTTNEIPGYGYGCAGRSPVAEIDLAEMKANVLFTDADVAASSRAGGVLAH